MVAAAGNDRARGNPTEFPAGLPHVLTVAATDKADQPSSFSNASLGVDLAAPGEDIPIAKPLAVEPSGFAVASGTSLSAPIVSGAAAWVWTVRPSLDVTQVFDLLRFSARDVARPGFDRESGFGVLDIRSALASRAPAPDPEEPNDDVFVVRPGGLLGAGQPPIAPPAAFVARLDVTEDPEDVYPLRIPHGARAVVSVGSSRDVDLELWRPGTRTVHETGAARRRDLAGRSARRGAAGEQVSFVNRGPGGTFYVNVFPGPDIGAASYRLSSVVRARR
jgi:subtilisin family serine protease